MRHPRPLDIRGIGMTSQRTRNRFAERLQAKGIQQEAVLDVMRKVPRHLFMDEAFASRSYEDTSLPIGYGQTISQPFIVARMTELLLQNQQAPLQNVLELGTGSGYQAAILGAFVQKLWTVERIEPLYQQARELLYDLGYRNIQCKLSDGHWGLASEAPFDGMIVTAAPETVPDTLLEQLAVGARLIIPIGKQGDTQQLQVITRNTDDQYHTENHEAVQFVPLLRDITH